MLYSVICSIIRFGLSWAKVFDRARMADRRSCVGFCQEHSFEFVRETCGQNLGGVTDPRRAEAEFYSTLDSCKLHRLH